jgi:hypothetical protein
MAPTGRPALPGCGATTRFVCSFIKTFTPCLPKADFAPLRSWNRHSHRGAATSDRYQNDIAALTRPAGGADHTGTRIRSCPSWAIDSETTHGHAKFVVHRGERGHRCSLGPHPRRPTILAKRGTTLRDRVSGDEAGQPESKVTRLGRSRHERH